MRNRAGVAAENETLQRFTASLQHYNEGKTCLERYCSLSNGQYQKERKLPKNTIGRNEVYWTSGLDCPPNNQCLSRAAAASAGGGACLKETQDKADAWGKTQMHMHCFKHIDSPDKSKTLVGLIQWHGLCIEAICMFKWLPCTEISTWQVMRAWN